MPLCTVVPRRAESMTLAKPYLQRLLSRSPSLPAHVRRYRRPRTLASQATQAGNTVNNTPAITIDSRKRKNVKHEPSRLISAALRNAGYNAATTAGTLPKPKQNGPLQRGKAFSRTRRVRFETRESHPTIHNLLYRFIRRNAGRLPLRTGDDPAPSIARARLLGKHVTFLESRGYTVGDLVFWASLLTTEKIDASAQMLLEHGAASQRNAQMQTPIPNIVLMYLLRRPLIPSALRNFISYAWQQLHRKRDGNLQERFARLNVATEPGSVDKIAVMNNAAIFRMVSLLCTHATTIWPQSLPSITALFIFNVNLNSELHAIPSNIEVAGTSRMRELEAQCNYMLSRLAVPSPANPFHAVEFHERAQFDLLRCMSEQKPPLIITREGYRGIVSIQLRQKKNDQERDWASLKAKSWPPWKEEKTGFDAEKDADYGASRALKVLWSMREAGYGSLLWERVSEIYTGRDVDQSPTIQTRALLKSKSPSARVLSTDKDHHMIWAARIRTTRTLQEAWACFLEYKEKHIQRNEHVYFAMLEKVVSNETQSKTHVKIRHGTTESDPLLPGDMKDTIPAPISPKEETYVPVDPPSSHMLAKEMYDHNIPMGERCLCLLLKNAKSSEMGLTYIGWAKEKDPILECLRAPQATASDLQLVPEKLLNAYVTFLCNFPTEVSPAPCKVELKNPAKYIAGPIFPNVVAAIRIIQTLLPQYRPPWHTALSAIINPSKSLSRAKKRKQMSPSDIIEKFFLAQRLQRQMDSSGLAPDFETFRLVGRGLENAVRSAKAFLHSKDNIGEDRPTTSEETLVAANRVLDQGTYINRMFFDIVGPDTTSVTPASKDMSFASAKIPIPSTLAYPYPAYLHQFVRVLGFLHSWKRLVEFVEWMVIHQEEVLAASVMPRNGRAMLRKTIVAVRAFAESSWVQYERNDYGELVPLLVEKGHDQQELTETSAPASMLETMIDGIHTVEGFGGWATDDEVIDYCIHGGFVDGHNEGR